MKTNVRLTLSSLFWAMVLLLAYAAAAQTQTKVNDNRNSTAQKTARAGQTSIAGATTPVTGSGTTGYLTKWVGVPGASVIGDTNLFEDKFGRVGIGTTALTSKLTVQGMLRRRSAATNSPTARFRPRQASPPIKS